MSVQVLPTPAFEVDVTSSGDRTIVTASGEVDVAAAPALRAALSRASRLVPASRRHAPVLVDLAGVTFLDSRALRVLADAALASRRIGRELVLVDPNPVMVRLLTITGLLSLFRLGRGSALLDRDGDEQRRSASGRTGDLHSAAQRLDAVS